MADTQTNTVVGVADDSANVVGAPLPQEQAGYVPMLKGFGPEKVVTVFNPLPNDFRFQHARSVAQPAPLDKDRQYAQDKGGLSLTKDEASPQLAHYAQYWILKAGESKNLPGDIAQKAVRDLTNYILMQRAGKGQPKTVADGYARLQVEKEIVLNVSDNVSFLNASTPQDISQAAQQEIENLNPPAPPTPAESVEPPDPPPGQGVRYEKPAKANK